MTRPVVPGITPLSDPPTREDPDNFEARADQFLGEDLPTYAEESNAAIDAQNDLGEWFEETADLVAGYPGGERLVYDATTTDADPGNGEIRLNHATLSSVTMLYIDDLNADGAAISAWLDTFDDGTSTIKGQIALKEGGTGKFARYNVNGAVVNGTGYRKIPVAHVDSSGPFTAASNIGVAFTKNGDKGDAGSISSVDVLILRGQLNCAANPNYPAADAGDIYIVSVAGKIGGGSGPNVEAGDVLTCTVDSTASGNHATVGANWVIGQTNVDGAVVYTGSATTDAYFALASGTSGKALQFASPAAVRTALGVNNVDNVAVIGRHSLWIPASAMVSRATNGAATGKVETASNRNNYGTLDFDTSTVEYAQYLWGPPKKWNRSTVTFMAVWSHPSTTTNFGVAISMAGVAISNDDAGDVARGTAITVTDTGGTTDDLYMTAESAAVTIAGTPAADDVILLEFARQTANGSDTMAVDMRLHGVLLFITTNAGNDV